jgi:hypothetical protein
MDKDKCPWKPCGTLDCCEFGPNDCEHRKLVQLFPPDEPAPKLTIDGDKGECYTSSAGGAGGPDRCGE